MIFYVKSMFGLHYNTDRAFTKGSVRALIALLNVHPKYLHLVQS